TRAAIRIDGARGRGPEQCRNDVCGRANRTARTTNRDAAVGSLPADLAARALELDRDGIRLDAGSLRDGADRHPGAELTGRGVLRDGPGSTAIGADCLALGADFQSARKGSLGSTPAVR